MNTMNIKNGPQNVPVIIRGFMRVPDLSIEEAAKVIENAYDLGVMFFNHAGERILITLHPVSQ